MRGLRFSSEELYKGGVSLENPDPIWNNPETSVTNSAFYRFGKGFG